MGNIRTIRLQSPLVGVLESQTPGLSQQRPLAFSQIARGIMRTFEWSYLGHKGYKRSGRKITFVIKLSSIFETELLKPINPK